METIRRPSAAHAELIHRSHARSAACGLRPGDKPEPSAVSAAALSEAIAQSRRVLRLALPAMESLYEQIAHTHSIVLLADAHGLVLHSQGDADFVEKANRVALARGVDWSELRRGTNGIGTALVERVPVQVNADEHYLGMNTLLHCSAVPLFGADGNVSGVLNVSGDARDFHPHTLALARMSAMQIEHRLFVASCEDCITLHFHRSSEWIGSAMEGLISFAFDGRFVSANAAARAQLGRAGQTLDGGTLESLFALSASAVLDHCKSASAGLIQVTLPDGTRTLAKVSVHQSVARHGHASQRVRHADGQHEAPKPELHAVHHEVPPRSLQQLDTGDPQMSSIVAKLTRLKGRDLPVLITGETGTGKEVLARCIHGDSPRRDGPFVAVNCASIPEGLVESELFGYDEGAFTGARKRGSPGRIAQANTGTLFLDEIGDMPLNVQSRLLRALQERVVTPLGSTRAIPVNISIVCATHRDLRELIERGSFREDLFYRLNGLQVKLPALRTRSDFDIVLQRVLDAESGGKRYRIAPEVLELLRRYHWPGNFRQLVNIVRASLLMVDDDEIRMEHLPDDLLADSARLPADRSPAILRPSVGALDELESSVVRATLESHAGNVAAAARALGVSRNRIYRKIRSSGERS